MSTHAHTESQLPRWLVQNRNFVLLWAAYGISAFGDHLSEMALLKEVGGFERDNVTRVQALMTFCFFLPFVLFGPLAGWWADRFSRKWTMIASDVLRAGVSLSLIVIIHPLLDLGLGDFSIAIPLLLTGVFAAYFSPCRQAMVPTLIRGDQLVRANAMISALGTIGAIMSGIVGGMLVDWAMRGHFGLYWNYIADASTFILSGILILGINMSRSRAVPHEMAPGVLEPIVDGFRYVWQHRRVLQIILLGTVFWAGAGVVISVVPAIVRDVFAGDYTDAGMYRGLIAAGLAIGAAVLTIVGRSLPVPLAILVAVLGGSAWIFALDVAYIFKLGRIFTGLCLLMIGVHGAGILVNVMVIIQQFVPDARRGRVFGVSDMSTMAAIVASTGLLGLPHIEHLDRYVPWLLGVVGLALLVTGLIAWGVYRRGDEGSGLLWVLWRIVKFYVQFWSRVRRDGPCTVPRTGPVIVAANHTCGIDPLVMIATSPYRLMGFLVERKYYSLPLVGWFMRLVDCVPVDRENPQKSFLANSLRLLKAGGCLGIFPQGTYAAPDEPIPEPKAGVGILALRTGATVIPVHISGTVYDYHPLWALIRRHKARIRYGKPIDLSAFAGREKDKQAPQEVAELIWREIQSLAPDEGGQ